MTVGEMITLSNKNSYGLLLDAVLNDNKYFLAVLLNEREEPTEKYVVLKEEFDGENISVIEENDVVILSKLLDDYSLQLEDEN